jgi:hypothetical protein
MSHLPSGASRRTLVSNSANTPSMSRDYCRRGAGVDRLLGRLEGNAALSKVVDDVLQVAQKPGEAVVRVTISVSPSRRNSSSVASSSRLSVLVAVIFSDRITAQPAAVSAACWMDKS